MPRDAIGAPLTASSFGRLPSNPARPASLRRLQRIPARLITEIILRMMRFGWVELAAAPKGASFRATEAGREVD